MDAKGIEKVCAKDDTYTLIECKFSVSFFVFVICLPDTYTLIECKSS